MTEGLMLGVGLVSELVALLLNDPVVLPLVNLDKPSPRLRNGLFTFAASVGAPYRERKDNFYRLNVLNENVYMLLILIQLLFDKNKKQI